MSNVFDVPVVVVKTLVDEDWVRVGYISEVTTDGLTSQEWTLLGGFDSRVRAPMQFSHATAQDIGEVDAVARCLGKTVVTSFSQDFVDPPQGADNAAIEERWKDRAAGILNATCVQATLARQGTTLVAVKQISPNFKTAPFQNETPDLTLPWLKVIPFNYLNRPFTAEVWYVSALGANTPRSFEIQACDNCAPNYPAEGRYTLMVAPAPAELAPPAPPA